MPVLGLLFIVWLCLSTVGAIAGAVTVGVLLATRRAVAGSRCQAGRASGRVCPYCGAALETEMLPRPVTPKPVAGPAPPAGGRTAAAVICVLVVLQLVGILASTAAALWDVESVVVTGPVFAVVGLLTAALSYRGRLRIGFLFGLSVPVLALLCFTAIAAFEWSPAEAQFPIGVAICLFAVGAVPLGMVAAWRIVRGPIGARVELWGRGRLGKRHVAAAGMAG